VGGLPPPPVAPTTSVKTPRVGAPGGGNTWEDRPPSLPFIVGFRYTATTFVKSIQAIYLIEGARVATDTNGNPEENGPIEIAAKPGYAVGGIVVRGSTRVDQMKVLFMKISGRVLDPQDSYESAWFGGSGGGAEVKLAGDGAPIVGYFGRSGADLEAIGLIFLK